MKKSAAKSGSAPNEVPDAVCERTCMRACVRASVRACVCVRACMQRLRLGSDSKISSMPWDMRWAGSARGCKKSQRF